MHVSGVEVHGVGGRERQPETREGTQGQMISRTLIISIPGANRNPCEGQLEVMERPNSFPPLGGWDWDGQGEQVERAVWLQGAPFSFPSSVQLVSLLPMLTLAMPSEKNGKMTFTETLHSKTG